MGYNLSASTEFLLIEIESDGTLPSDCPSWSVFPYVTSISIPVDTPNLICTSPPILSSQPTLVVTSPLINHTVIHYSLGGAGYGKIKIYDLCGRLIDLIEINKPQGSVVWQPKRYLPQSR